MNSESESRGENRGKMETNRAKEIKGPRKAQGTLCDAMRCDAMQLLLLCYACLLGV
jgi:hypothetical protein